MFRPRSTRRTEINTAEQTGLEQPRWHKSRWTFLGAVVLSQLAVVGVAYGAAKDVVSDGKHTFDKSADEAIRSAEDFYESRIGKVDEVVVRFDQAKKACLFVQEYKPVIDMLQGLATTTTILEQNTETAGTAETPTTTP